MTLALPRLPLSFSNSRKELEYLDKFDEYIRLAQATSKSTVTKNVNLAAKTATKELQTKEGFKHIIDCIIEISRDMHSHKETAVYLVDSIMVHASHYCDEITLARYEKGFLPLLTKLFKRVMSDKRGPWREAIVSKFLNKILPKWEEHGWFDQEEHGILDRIKAICLKKVSRGMKRQYGIDTESAFASEHGGDFDDEEDEETSAKQAVMDAIKAIGAVKMREKFATVAVKKSPPLPVKIEDTADDNSILRMVPKTPLPIVNETTAYNPILNKVPMTPMHGMPAPSTPFAAFGSAQAPGTPRAFGAQAPGTPFQVPGTPRVPQMPGTPRAPQVPGTPNVSQIQVPGTPRAPQVPGTPNVSQVQVPGTPRAPQVPGTPNVSVQVPGTPRLPPVPPMQSAAAELLNVVPRTPLPLQSSGTSAGAAAPSTPFGSRQPQPFTPAQISGAPQPFTPAGAQPFTPAPGGTVQPFTPAPGAQPFTPAPGAAPFTPMPGASQAPFTPGPGVQPFTPAPGAQPFTPAPIPNTPANDFSRPERTVAPMTPSIAPPVPGPVVDKTTTAPITPGDEPGTPVGPPVGVGQPSTPVPGVVTTPAPLAAAPGTPGRKRGKIPNTPTAAVEAWARAPTPMTPGMETPAAGLNKDASGAPAPGTPGKRRGRIPSTIAVKTEMQDALPSAIAEGMTPLLPPAADPNSGITPPDDGMTPVPAQGDVTPMVRIAAQATLELPSAAGEVSPAPASGENTPVPHTLSRADPGAIGTNELRTEPTLDLELAQQATLELGKETPIGQLYGEETPLPMAQKVAEPQAEEGESDMPPSKRRKTGESEPVDSEDLPPTEELPTK